MPSFVFRTEKNNRVMLYIRRILEGLCAYCPPVLSCLPSNHTVSAEKITHLRYMRYCSDYYNLG